MRELEPPARAFPRLCSDNHTKAPKPLFESPQRFGVSIRPELIAELSEYIINKNEFSFLISH
jgi:hypothetical protein